MNPGWPASGAKPGENRRALELNHDSKHAPTSLTHQYPHDNPPAQQISAALSSAPDFTRNQVLSEARTHEYSVRVSVGCRRCTAVSRSVPSLAEELSERTRDSALPLGFAVASQN